jgi:hypothetical protein
MELSEYNTEQINYGISQTVFSQDFCIASHTLFNKFFHQREESTLGFQLVLYKAPWLKELVIPPKGRVQLLPRV